MSDKTQEYLDSTAKMANFRTKVIQQGHKVIDPGFI